MRIVLLEPLGIPSRDLAALIEPLKAKGHEVVAYDERTDSEEELMARAAGADVLVVANQPLSHRVIASVENLSMISVAFTGVDHIDRTACLEKGVTVCNAAGYSTDSVAELAFGLMISVLRNIIPCDAAVRSGGTRAAFPGRDLAGKTLGIIGTGSIGLRVAEIGRAFGCRLLGYSRTRRQAAVDLGIEYVSLEELLRQSDIVTIHTPLNADTRLLINRDRIALMKPTAILVNTARGPIVDNEALAEALNAGRIAGAGIDVFEVEPPLPAEHPLLHAKNTVVTPHIGFSTAEALYRRARITIDNIEAWLAGTPKNVVIG